MGRAHEMRDAGRLVGDGLTGVVGIVEDVHRAVVRRVDSFLPPPAAPVMAAQGAIVDLVYAAVTLGHRLGPAAGGEVLARTGDPDAPAPSQTRAGRLVVPAVNGLWGDAVAARGPALAVPMAVRVDATDVPLDPASVAAAFPDAAPDLVVFVHGLCEGDEAWWLRADGAADEDEDEDKGQPRGSYGDRLRTDLGLTPVYLRYNTGLRVSDNGRALAALLDQLVASWPVPVASIALVGHSMGGLVVRSACHYAASDGAAWPDAVRTVVTLGTPHLGAPLEKGANVADWLLRRLPETEPLGRVLRARSLGIKDLRHGALVEEDWYGHDPDEFLRDRCTEVPLLEQATYYWVAASLTRDVEHPAGQLLGDGLVRYPSASGAGRTRRIPFEIDNGAHLGGLDHLSLLNHPAVYARLRDWLAE